MCQVQEKRKQECAVANGPVGQVNSRAVGNDALQVDQNAGQLGWKLIREFKGRSEGGGARCVSMDGDVLACRGP